MSEPILDLEDFLDRVQDDKELLLELLDIYEEDYGSKRIALTKAVAEKNYEDIRGIAHSLKGASGNISAKAVREIFCILEEKGKKCDLTGAEEDLMLLDQHYGELKERIDQVREEFK